ncbi:MAG: thioredoxin family protein [Bacteroidota bacterium]|nr:thioredoxin family protein [Bacteroidota bacterium]
MAVKETSDDRLIFELLNNERVILKYHTDTCGEICLKLKVVYDELSEGGIYNDIAFLRINADNNPIALKHINERKQPIMNIYHNGFLVECRTVDTKERIEDLLNKLATFNTKK